MSTFTDIKLNPLTHDIDLTDNNITLNLTSNAIIAQKVKVSLLTKQGELFTDLLYGVPYYQELFSQKNNKSFVDNLIIQYINDIDGVNRVIAYNSYIDNKRVLNIKVTIETEHNETVVISLNADEQQGEWQ